MLLSLLWNETLDFFFFCKANLYPLRCLFKFYFIWTFKRHLILLPTLTNSLFSSHYYKNILKIWTLYKPAHRKRHKWNAHSRRPRVEGPGLIWSWYLGEPGALLRAGVDQTTWRLVGVAAASLGDSRPSGAVGKHGWIRAEKTVGTYAGWSGNVPHAGKLFLRINNDVKHGPFNLTFSFLKRCTSSLFTSAMTSALRT